MLECYDSNASPMQSNKTKRIKKKSLDGSNFKTPK